MYKSGWEHLFSNRKNRKIIYLLYLFLLVFHTIDLSSIFVGKKLEKFSSLYALTKSASFHKSASFQGDDLQ